MDKKNMSKKKTWDQVKKILGKRRITLGEHWSFNLLNDPKRLAFVLSRYKFAAKMAARDKRILELGCSEGIGTPFLAEFAESYLGIDMDGDAIRTAQANWKDEKIKFLQDDFLEKTYGSFDTVISLDVVEHIHAEIEGRFFNTVYDNLIDEGVALVGTPNVTAAKYQSETSKAGHVNMFDASRLKQKMETFFHNVFVFGLNDEVVHTGFTPMVHYLICLACNKKQL